MKMTSFLAPILLFFLFFASLEITQQAHSLTLLFEDEYTVAPKVTTESVQANFNPDRTEYRIKGRVIFYKNPLPEIKNFITTVVWTPKTGSVKERTEVIGSDEKGKLTANCPADPVIFDGQCTGAAFQGLYTDPILSNIRGQLISRNILSDDQKITLQSQLQDAFPPPVFYRPYPNSVYGDNHRTPEGKYRVNITVAVLYGSSIILELKKKSTVNGKTEVQTRQYKLQPDYGSQGPKGIVYVKNLELDMGVYEVKAIVDGVETIKNIKNSATVPFSVMGSVDLPDARGTMLAKDKLQIIEPKQDQVYAGADQDGNIPYSIRLGLPSSPASPYLDLTIRSIGTAPITETIPHHNKAEIFIEKHGSPGEYFLDVKMHDEPWHKSEMVSFRIDMEASVPIPSGQTSRAKTSLYFRVPTQNVVFNDINDEGNIVFNYWLILPNKTDIELQINKGSEIVYNEIITKDRLHVYPESTTGRKYEYQATHIPLSAGKYTIKAKQNEGVNQAWSSPVTFYLGMAEALKDSGKGERASIKNPYALKGEVIKPITPVEAKQRVIESQASLDGEKANRAKLKAGQANVNFENAPITRTPAPEINQRSGDSPLPSGLNATPDRNLDIVESSGFGVPKIIRPADNSTFIIKKGAQRCIPIEIEFPASILADNKNSANSQSKWGASIGWHHSRKNTSASQGGSNSFELKDSNLVHEICMPVGTLELRACTVKEKRSEISGWESTGRYCTPRREITIIQPDQPQQTIEAAQSSGTIIDNKPELAAAKSLKTAPTLLALPRGKTISTNSLVSLPVKHTAGQKPVYEFEYHDGVTWRKARSIIQIPLQTPKGGSGQVITQAKFRFGRAGKYRYRVQTGNMASPFQEFVVADQLAKTADKAHTRTKVGGPGTKTEIKSLSQSTKPGFQKSSAGQTRVSESVAPKAKGPIVWHFPPDPSPPVIISPTKNQTFSAPANVPIRYKHDSSWNVIIELNGPGMEKDKYKIVNGKKILGNLPVGTYRIRVKYEGSLDGPEVAFKVIMKKPPIKKQAVKAQSQPQPQTQQQTEKVPQGSTTPPVRRRVTTQ